MDRNLTSNLWEFDFRLHFNKAEWNIALFLNQMCHKHMEMDNLNFLAYGIIDFGLATESKKRSIEINGTS